MIITERQVAYLLDAPPGTNIWDVAHWLVAEQDRTDRPRPCNGFVFNGVVVRRLFGETAEVLVNKYTTEIQK